MTTRTGRTLGAPVLALLAPLGLGWTAEDGVADEAVANAPVLWQGETHRAGALPEALPPAARAAVDFWAQWAGPAGYRFSLEDEGRVLVVASEKTSKSIDRARMELVERTVTMFEELLPPPAERLPIEPLAHAPAEAAAEEEPADGTEGGPLPEDPEGGPLPWEILGRPAPAEQTTWSYSWGASGAPPDGETIVFLIVHSEEDFGAMLDFLAERHPYLAGWAKDARRFTGFTLEEPLAGAYVENADGMEEFDPDGELVNRIAQLLLLRRFGRQPYWLVQGWAWCVEFGLRGAVYCFPYRDEWVGVGEHTDWDKELRQRFSAKKKQALRMADFAGYQRGKYVDSKAKCSWGVVDYLTRERTSALPALFEELRVTHVENSRIDKGGGVWELDRGYVLPLSEQERLLEKHLGKDFLERATGFFRGD